MLAREKLGRKLYSAGTDLPDAEIPVDTGAGTLPHEEASTVLIEGWLFHHACMYAACSNIKVQDNHRKGWVYWHLETLMHICPL
jgi:hypothetical protein